MGLNLKERLQADVAASMRAGETDRRDTLRLLLAAVKQEEIDQRVELDDSGVTAVLARQAKQRRESIADAERAGRPGLAAQEQAELKVIEVYLPQMMSAEDIRSAAQEIIVEVGASSLSDLGQVMGRLMPRLKGKADGRLVNQVVRELLQG